MASLTLLTPRQSQSSGGVALRGKRAAGGQDLRHCAGNALPRRQSPMKKIQALLGHSSYSLTADTYTSVLPQFEKAEADAPVALVPRAGKPQKPPAEPEVPSDEPGQTAA